MLPMVLWKERMKRRGGRQQGSAALTAVVSPQGDEAQHEATVTALPQHLSPAQGLLRCFSSCASALLLSWLSDHHSSASAFPSLQQQWVGLFLQTETHRH